MGAKDRDTDEVIGVVIAEVKARLFASSVSWLLVFDNLDYCSLLNRFFPEVLTVQGSILVTTRLTIDHNHHTMDSSPWNASNPPIFSVVPPVLSTLTKPRMPWRPLQLPNVLEIPAGVWLWRVMWDARNISRCTCSRCL